MSLILGFTATAFLISLKLCEQKFLSLQRELLNFW